MILLLSFLLMFSTGSTYASPNELSENEKAELFSKVMGVPIWYEVTINGSERAVERAKVIAELKVRQIFRERLAETKGLNLEKNMIDFSRLIKITEEDTTGIYGKPYEVEKDNKIISNVKFRFKLECDTQTIRDVNPFILKVHTNKPSFIKEFKETDYYWEIVAVGYGFYESFEDIDSKIRISGNIGVENACQAVIKKAAELGITDKAVLESITSTIKAKKNYGGIYWVLGCGVEVEKPIPIRINKTDFSVSFIYN